MRFCKQNRGNGEEGRECWQRFEGTGYSVCTGEARRSRDSADRAVEQLSVGSWFLDFGELEEKPLVSLEEKDGEAIGRNIQKETTVLTSPFLEVGGKTN